MNFVSSVNTVTQVVSSSNSRRVESVLPDSSANNAQNHNTQSVEKLNSGLKQNSLARKSEKEEQNQKSPTPQQLSNTYNQPNDVGDRKGSILNIVV